MNFVPIFANGIVDLRRYGYTAELCSRHRDFNSWCIFVNGNLACSTYRDWLWTISGTDFYACIMEGRTVWKNTWNEKKTLSRKYGSAWPLRERCRLVLKAAFTFIAKLAVVLGVFGNERLAYLCTLCIKGIEMLVGWKMIGTGVTQDEATMFARTKNAW